MFFAVIALILLVNFAYLFVTLYELWKKSKREKLRVKKVLEHGVHSMIKNVEEKFNIGGNQQPMID